MSQESPLSLIEESSTELVDEGTSVASLSSSSLSDLVDAGTGCYQKKYVKENSPI